jgi:hypothetical protein
MKIIFIFNIKYKGDEVAKFVEKHFVDELKKTKSF